MIKFENITKKFGNFSAVKNLNLEINDGEVFGLLGRNGAGKSTTMKMATSLLKPTNGNIYYDGKDLYENLLDIKKNIAYIPDTPYIYEKLTGIEFLIFIGSLWGLNKKKIEQRAKPLIELFNLEDIIMRKTEEFSHGSKQKLIFTASLIHDPKYLIVDEPMVGLDVQSAKAVKELFKLLTKKGKTVVLTTHQMDVVEQVCDKAVIIDNGQIKTTFNNKNDFKNLEDIFIKITGGYSNKLIEKFLEN